MWGPEKIPQREAKDLVDRALEVFKREKIEGMQVYESWEEVDEQTRREIINAFIENYGGEPWNEGGICSRCRSKISLADFRSHQESQTLNCECGGVFEPFYNPEEVAQDLQERFQPSDRFKPRLAVLKNEAGELIGVSMGVVLSPENLEDRIWSELYIRKAYGGNRQEFEKDIQELKEKIPELKERGRILLFEDIFINPKYRGGRHVLELARMIYRHGAKNGVRQLIAITQPDSKAYRNLQKAGCKDLASFGEAVFQYSPDLRLPLLGAEILSSDAYARLINFLQRFLRVKKSK